MKHYIIKYVLLTGVLLLSNFAYGQSPDTIFGEILTEQKEGIPNAYVLLFDQNNSSFYKVNPGANLENLIAKMPGITVNGNKIQVGGEEVRKVTIDGQGFFGNDVLIALRTLPAKIVSKIQVFDKERNQARFSGFMDANTLKTINIITKKPDGKLTFGKLRAGYGIDKRYDTGGHLNYFSGKQKISLIGTANNINQQNFSTEGLLGVSVGGMKRGGIKDRPLGVNGEGISDFLISNQEGINTTNTVGLNYIDKWGDKVSINGSYFFNQVVNNKHIFTNRLFTISSDGEMNRYREDDTQNSDNFNHRFQFKMKYLINTKNVLIANTKLTFQKNQVLGLIDGKNLWNLQAATNETVTKSDNNDTGINWNGNLLYLHQFEKNGRTISLDLAYNLSSSSGENILNYYTYDFLKDSITAEQNQFTETGFYANTYTANVNFTEKIGAKFKVLFNYNTTVTHAENRQENFILDDFSNTYSTLDTLQTSQFSPQIFTQKIGLTFQYHFKKSTLNLGLVYQNTHLQADYTFPELPPIDDVFQSVLPTIMFMHRFNANSNIRVVARSGNSLPSVTQLQEVLDISNPFEFKIGNSNLKQGYHNTIMTRFARTNLSKGKSFFTFLMAQYTKDYIGQLSYIDQDNTVAVNHILLQPNIRLISYKNFNSQLTIRSFFTYGIPITVFRSNLNFNGGVSYCTIPGETNEVLNEVYATGLNLGWVLSSNISEKIDFLLSYTANQNWVNNSNLQMNNNKYTIHKVLLKFNYIAFKRLVFNTEVMLKNYQGLSDLENNVPLFWNLSVAYKWFKKQKIETRFSVFDVLNQNTAITRNITPFYIEDVSTTILKRYFTFTLSYKFFASK